MERVIGVIGGSGLYDMVDLQEVERVAVDTPFGTPSDDYRVGQLGDAKLVFLPRHGRGHRLLPHEINYRANIHGMKQLGVEWLISISAVGSLREEIRPGDLVVVDQFVDRTRNRRSTFFGDGVAAHVAFADPVDSGLAGILVTSAREAVAAAGTGARVHDKGTYVVMDGPLFSSRAESNLYRSWGMDIIGMTNLPEAKLAREAELSYATLALCTDYDCWREESADVDITQILAVIKQNVATAQDVVRRAVPRIRGERDPRCSRALEHAIMTDRAAIPAEARARLQLLIGRYL